MSTTTIDERLRERAAAEWKAKVEAEIARFREKFPAHSLDETPGKFAQVYGLKVTGPDGAQVSHRGGQVTVKGALILLESALIAAGTSPAGQRAVDEFLARVERVQVDLQDVRTIIEDHRHD